MAPNAPSRLSGSAPLGTFIPSESAHVMRLPFIRANRLHSPPPLRTGTHASLPAYRSTGTPGHVVRPVLYITCIILTLITLHRTEGLIKSYHRSVYNAINAHVTLNLVCCASCHVSFNGFTKHLLAGKPLHKEPWLSCTFKM